MKNVFISAFNIHTGGGYVLLEDFLKIPKKIIFLLDHRIKNKKNINKFFLKINFFVKKNIFIRIFKFIFFCLKANKKNSVFICLNSLPPFLRLKSKTIIFIQNTLFFERLMGNKLSLKLRILFEKIWFRFGIQNCDEFWVQTETMKKNLKKYFLRNKMKKVNFKGIYTRVLVDKKSFLALKKHFQKKSFNKIYLSNKNKIKLFFYPADGYFHKNHTNLIKAFNSLEKCLKWKLILTINYKSLNEIYKKNNISYETQLKIINLGQIRRTKVMKILKLCDVLIFPSINESFGLPLLESCLLRKPILASNRDYVFDILKKPNSKLLFNCFSYKSIANKILYFINANKIKYSCQLKPELSKFCDATNFLKKAIV
jgi:glycosyltransferase involved in cell wall biosynthesis